MKKAAEDDQRYQSGRLHYLKLNNNNKQTFALMYPEVLKGMTQN